MNTTQFRLHGKLNDFVPPVRRRRFFEYKYRGTPAVKDAVESLGVPHTAVDIIIADGLSVDFDYRLQPGAEIDIYPRGCVSSAENVINLRPPPLSHHAFILDVHLGKCAGNLRLLGFDSLYRNDYRDHEIIRIGLAEDRIILTRDLGILKNGAVRRGYWLRSQNPLIQCREVIEEFDLEEWIKPFTRCLDCNGLLEAVEKEKIKLRLEPKTRRYYRDFKICRGCGKLYWRGSHWRALQKKIRRLTAW